MIRASTSVMMMATAAAISGCNQKASEQPSNAVASLNTTTAQEAPPPPPATGPDARTPFGEPKSVIDPKSPEAAQALVQEFAHRLQERQFGEAYDLISQVLPTWKESEFAADYSVRREIRAAVGKPAAPEGAAGSVYVTVPMVVTGRYRGGRPYSESWTLTLRRVNDVPGSTDTQRRWHIERIEWKDGA